MTQRTTASAPGQSPLDQSLPGQGGNDASRLVDGVFEWLEPRLPAGPPLDRALALNLAPGLAGWAVGRSAKDERAAVGGASSWRRLVVALRDYLPHFGELPEDVAMPAHEAARTDLLAICLQPNSTRAFVPVATRLRDAGIKVRFLLEYGDTRSEQLLLHAGLSFRTTPPFGRVELWAASAASYQRLSRFWRDEPGLLELVRTLGLPGPEGSHVSNLRKVLHRALVRGALRGAAIHSALLALPASNVLFVTHRALLNHLLYDTHPLARRFFFLQGVVPDIPPHRTKLDVDHAIVGSEVDLPYVLRCGLTRSQITITGYPDYDHYASIDRDQSRKDVDARLPAAKGRKLVVFTSQYKTAGFSDWARLENLRVMLAAAREMPEVQFVAKLHPRMELMPTFELPENVVLEQHTDTPRLIKAADALVTYWSTTALEAILLGTPLLQLNATGLPDFFDLSTPRGRPIARSAPELVRLLRTVLSDGGSSLAPVVSETRLGNGLSVTLDGHAADRASEALLARIIRS